MNSQTLSSYLKLISPVLIPILAGLLQYLLWSQLPPLTWIFLYPAVFLSAWISGFSGGLLATGITLMLGIYYFIQPYDSWAIADFRNVYSAGIFLFMGTMFSVVFERLHRTTAELERISNLKLETHQKRLTQALHAANAGIWEWNVITNQNKWTDSLWQLYGLEPNSGEASYNTWLESVHPDDRDLAEAAIQRAMAKHAELNMEWRVAKQFDGKDRWLMSRGQPEFNDQGNLLMYRGIVIDISDRKLIEKQLQDQEQRLSFALETLQSGAWELDLDTHNAHRTVLHDQIFGYPELLSNWTYEIFLDHVVPEDRANVDACFNTANANQSDWSFDCRIRRKDDAIRWIWAKGRHKFDATGGAVSLSGIVQDITERKLIEDPLKTSEKEFRLLAEAMPQIVWITGADGWNIYFNQQWVEYTGLSLEESYGNGWNIPFHPDDKQTAWDAWQNAVHNKGTYALECRLRRADGIYRWWLIRGIPVLDETDKILKWFGTCTDINDIKAAEVALRESETRWQFALEGSNQGVWDWDIPANKVFYSNRWRTMLGYTEQEISDRVENWSERVHPDDLQPALDAVQKHWRGESTFYQNEHRMLNSQGQYQWISARGIVVSRDADGQPLRMIGTHNDISERKINEAKLREKERLLADSQAVAHIGSWMVDLISGQIHWSEETFRLHGLSPETDVPPTREQFPQLFHPDDRPALRDWINTLLTGNQSTGLEFRTKPINDESRWLLAIAQVEKGAGGEPLRIIGTVQDITDKKLMAAEKQRWADAFEYCAHGIVIGNPDTNRILTCNPAFANMMGYTGTEQIAGMLILDLYSPQHTELIKAYLNKADQLGKIRYESTYQRHDGSELDILVDLVSVKNAENKVIYRVATIQNISERKKQEAELLKYRDHLQHLVEERTLELTEAREQAERLTEVKSTFLANMSHEIRSPMNAVLGFCYLLDQRSLDEDTRSLVRKIHSSGHLLLGIINDILDFSKIEAGRLVIENVPFRLSDLLDHLAALMAGSAGNKNLELVIMPPANVDALIGDGMRIQQVLVNLLSNAIKFTEQGEVKLRVSIEYENLDQVKLRFAVRDTGIGISSEQQQDIFSAFTQADNTISRRFGGSGLGLAISQQLIGLMGGQLQVESIVGQGSKFWFVLPLQRNRQLENTPSQLTDLHLLIADDSSTAREALLLISHSLGWRADAAESGEAAIMRTLAKLDSPSPYDVLLLDWQMPGVDGLTVAQAVHEAMSKTNIPSSENAPIVLMVTAHSREELLTQSGMDKVDAVLSKPITASALYNAVASILQKRRTDGPTYISAAKFGRRIPDVRVLVVDDNDINREVEQRILEGDGAVVSVVNDGQEALEWLTIHSDEVDIVLMDIQMPRMDGYTATRKIRQNPNWANLPIIALTAGATKDLEVTALAAGMNDFITKPFNVPQMIALIQQITGCKPEAGITTMESITSEYQISKHTLPGVDVETGLKTWGQIDVYQTYLSRFIRHYHDAAQKIAHSSQHGEHDTAAALTHKLKGAAYSLALETVAQRSIDIETALKNGVSVTSTTEALQQAIDEVAASLSSWLVIESGAEAKHQDIATLPEEIKDLLAQLMSALDEDNPINAEQLLGTIEGLLGIEAIAPIKVQIQNFNFRQAEVLVQSLMHKLNKS